MNMLPKEKRKDEIEVLAPICLFTYNRIAKTIFTIEALLQNHLAYQSEIFIFSDGWDNENSKNEVIEVRNFLKTIVGFKKITIIESDINKGLADSIIDGVNQVIDVFDQVIVLEDDLYSAPNFLDYMNQCLTFYRNDDSIISISGYSVAFNLPKGYEGDVYLNGRTSSWGWATWKKDWDLIDWEVKDWNTFKMNRNQRKNFNSNGSDMFSLLRSTMEGKNNSWAIRFCYTQFKLKKFTIYPIISKIDNLGFGPDASNCKGDNRFIIDLDSGLKRTFNLPEKLAFNKVIVDQVVAYFSVKARIKSKIAFLFYKLMS